MGYSAFPLVSTRTEMLSEIEKAIQNITPEAEEVVDTDEVSELVGKKYLKAMIIESNSPINKINLTNSIKLRNTQDEKLKMLLSNEKEKGYSYLDILDDRFWILYTIDNSANIKKDIDELIQANNSRLDYAWFASNFLTKIAAKFRKTSFTLQFENYFDNASIPLEKMSLRLWAKNANETMKELSGMKQLGMANAFSSIQVETNDVQRNFVKTSISKKGVFNIARGDSVEKFKEILEDAVFNNYKPLIKEIEEDNTIKYAINDSMKITGSPIRIRFDNSTNIEDIESFVTKLGRGATPFRILGLPKKIEEGHYLVSALDQHTFDSFSMEIYPDEMLVALPEGNCGNCITRLFTLIQSNFSPKTKIYGGAGELI